MHLNISTIKRKIENIQIRMQFGLCADANCLYSHCVRNPLSFQLSIALLCTSIDFHCRLAFPCLFVLIEFKAEENLCRAAAFSMRIGLANKSADI